MPYSAVYVDPYYYVLHHGNDDNGWIRRTLPWLDNREDCLWILHDRKHR